MPLLMKIQALTIPLLSRQEREGYLTRQIELILYAASPENWQPEHYKNIFHTLEQRGIHLTYNYFYSPIPDTREILASDLENRESEMVGIDLNLEVQLELLCKAFPQYRQEYSLLPLNASVDLPSHQFHFHNGVFDGLDAVVLYCMIRHFNPRRIIEIGSGWSTLLSAQAALKNGNTQLVCIEPFPNQVLKGGFPGLSSLITNRVEEVDLATFQELEEGDILFVDTTHVVKTNGDVNYLYLEVIPRLRKGVIVHIHDIFFPFEYPKCWITDSLLFWNEQYLVQAFLQFNSHFHPLFMVNYMRLKRLEEVKATFPDCPFFSSGSSLWIQKIN
jgi:hypothetical protein